ncbi:MAG: hypothetical protein R3F23_01590 [Verrucomicrobiia bacterium]
MTTIEAQKIIGDFHKTIKDSRPDAIVQSIKELPYSPARIKYAHFVYGEELIKTVQITEEILQEMMESYGIIDSFFVENPEPINVEYREYVDGLKKGIITDFRVPNPFGECEPVNQFRNFLGECWFLEHHTNLFKDNHVLGAFIYDVIRNKAVKEKDIKLLVEMTDTNLTRAVCYPGKR